MKIEMMGGLLIGALACFSSCKKDSPAAPFVPSVVSYTNSTGIVEDDPSRFVIINVTLSAKSDSIVTVNYATTDSSAVAGKDYTATSGALTFARGEQSKSIFVPILQDTARKEDAVFFVQMISAKNADFQAGKIRVKITNVDYANLVWSDEFNGTMLNTSDWNYELGNNNGWGNNEKETYTSSTDNAFVSGGYLTIKAIDAGSGTYTSARITTNGKQQFTHCRVDILAKLPQGQGIWPALWMLGSNISTVSWPACGEIDIMELLGQQPNKVYGTVHYDNGGHQQSGSNYSLSTGAFSDGFHLFSLVWTPNNLSWYIDKQQYFTVSKNSISGFPFDLSQFFIFNIAVGGNWPGNPDQTTVFPQTMTVDYIRVYQ